MKYRIIKCWSFGKPEWRVVLGTEFIIAFALRRDAVAWIMKQEFPK